MGTDSNDHLLYSIRNYLLEVSLLGEMITYLGMSMPMAAWSTITWSQNSKKSNGSEVEIQKLNAKHIAGLMIGCMIVTFLFYELLKYLNTPNLMFSTVSIVTSFLAATLTMLRSSYYALGYASNDIVLIILWVMASIKDPSYFPVVWRNVCNPDY